VLNGGDASGQIVAMIKMHADRDMRVDLDQRVDQLGQDDVVGIGTRTPAGLQDHRRTGFIGRGHDCQALFHVGHVEGGDGVTVLGGVIQKLSKGDAGHGWSYSSEGVR
jgi:hypothetical protein